MIKKAILIITTILGISASAQSVGEWTIYPLFDGNATTLVDGKSKVYYVTAGRLYSYDKDSNETYFYSTQNKLSDVTITGAYYNAEKEYMLLAYETGNIDIVYDNGRVVNLPEIKDASLTTAKTINHVAFYNNRIYIATIFGMVIYDDTNLQVVESGIYNKDLQYIAVNNGQIIVYPRDSYTVYRSPIDGRHNSFDKFTSWYGLYPTGYGSVGDNLYMINGNNNTLIIHIVDWNTFERTSHAREDITPLFPPEAQADGTLRVITANKVYVLDDEGNDISVTDIPADFTGKKLAYNSGLNSVWTLDSEGLGNYDLTTTPPTVLRDKARSEATTVERVAFFRLSDDGKRIYFSNIGDTKFKSIGDKNYGGHWFAQTTNYIEGNSIHDMSLYNATPYYNPGHCVNDQAGYSDKRLYGGVGRFAVDPSNPERYYIACNTEGFFVIENGVQVALLNYAVGPFPNTSGWSPYFQDANFDPEGNLWCGSWQHKTYGYYSPYCILTKDKLKTDLTKLTDDDWIMSKHFGMDGSAGTGSKDMGSLFCRHSNMLFTFSGEFEGPVVAYDTKGTYANVNDDVAYAMSYLVDQDGKTFKPQRTVCAVEDQRGRVWIGTTSGLYEITTPSKATDPTMRIRRLKVPRNDGTNYADYLLETEQINDIAVDGTNRKWIATESSGVYLVSEDGDQILEHFTTDNSMLPSNSVYSAVCDPNSNIVYFGLISGLVSYSSTSAPAASDYSEIYAYPNPVRPDYTGYITVTGLMDNSLVKIADSSGNVFAQGRSNGGMFVWDGCDSAGNRVRSGVYFVFASQNNDGNSSGAVTKILVIN